MAQDTPLGFPAHTLHPQGVCSIRRAAKPLTAALPYRRGEFTVLLTISSGCTPYGVHPLSLVLLVLFGAISLTAKSRTAAG